MATSGQLSLTHRGPLFAPEVVTQYLADASRSPIPDEAVKVELLAEWVRNLDASASSKETALEQEFNRVVLGRVLGYALHPSADATAWAKPPSKVTQITGEPDVALGRFDHAADPEFRAVVELKGPQPTWQLNARAVLSDAAWKALSRAVRERAARRAALRSMRSCCVDVAAART